MTYKNKHSFITIFLCTALTALCGCTGDTDIDPISGNGNSPASGTPLEVRTTVAPFQNPDPSTRAATRAVIDNISTKFENGDAIGLICFRQGPTGNYISEDISNLELVFTGTADGTGTWATKSGEDAINYTDAVSYLAYYPYISALDLTGITDVASAKKKILASFPSDYLANQQIPANFAMSDHMTAESTPVDVNGTPTLTLNFKHEFVLLVVKPTRGFFNIPPAGETAYKYYPMPVWKLDDKLVESTPGCFLQIQNNYACKMNNGSYAILVKPESITTNVKIDYKTKDANNQELTVSTQTSSSNYAAGTSNFIEVHNFKADDGEVPRALQVGDFVHTANDVVLIIPGDYPVDATNGIIPNTEDAAGIVTTTSESGRMTDEECIKKGWTHAYVMGLENLTTTGRTIWASSDAPITLLPEILMKSAEGDMNGYSETRIAQNQVGYDLGRYPIFNALSKFNSSTGCSGCSPWFLPSIGQWFDVLTNLGGKSPNDFSSTIGQSWEHHGYEARDIINRLNKHLAKAGREFSTTERVKTCFWLSSRYQSNYIWAYSCFLFNESSIVGIIPAEKDFSVPALADYVTARPFFAF